MTCFPPSLGEITCDQSSELLYILVWCSVHCEGISTKKYFSQVQRPTLPFLPVAVAFRPIGLSWFLALGWPILYSICGGQDNLTFHSLCWFVAHFYPYRDQNTACHLPDISVSYIVPGGEKLCRAVSCSVY